MSLHGRETRIADLTLRGEMFLSCICCHESKGQSSVFSVVTMHLSDRNTHLKKYMFALSPPIKKHPLFYLKNYKSYLATLLDLYGQPISDLM